MTGWVLIDGDDDVFDALRHNRQILLDAEVRELALIAQACDEWSVDESRADAAAERLVQGGSDGTATVGEFLALELGGLLQIGPAAAALRIRETLDLRDRHPELWAYVHAGGVRPWQALKIAQRCAAAELSLTAARWVDRQLMAGVAALGWSRTVRCLEGLIVKADVALAQERARLRREERRVFVGDHADGGSTLFARLDTGAAVALDQTIAAVSDALAGLGSDETLDQRRATALGILADPRAALDLLDGRGDGTPTNRTATVILHLSPESILPPRDGDSPAGVTRVDGIGALDARTMQRLLGASRVTVRPTVDLNDLPAVDSYEIPDRLRARAGPQPGRGLPVLDEAVGRPRPGSHDPQRRGGAARRPPDPGRQPRSALSEGAPGQDRAPVVPHPTRARTLPLDQPARIRLRGHRRGNRPPRTSDARPRRVTARRRRDQSARRRIGGPWDPMEVSFTEGRAAVHIVGHSTVPGSGRLLGATAVQRSHRSRRHAPPRAQTLSQNPGEESCAGAPLAAATGHYPAASPRLFRRRGHNR